MGHFIHIRLYPDLHLHLGLKLFVLRVDVVCSKFIVDVSKFTVDVSMFTGGVSKLTGSVLFGLSFCVNVCS